MLALLFVAAVLRDSKKGVVQLRMWLYSKSSFATLLVKKFGTLFIALFAAGASMRLKVKQDVATSF